MRLIILGAPGAGKGTQAEMLSKKLSIPHISTGDIFRINIRKGTELGKKADEYIEDGMLVPDDLTVGIVKERLKRDDCKNGFILDGFPRTIPQAEFLQKVLEKMEAELDAVLDIKVSDEEIIRRMSGRRVCPGCGMSYHILFNPPKDSGICDGCRTKVVQREDDSEETVIKRLKIYHIQTEPLIDYYRRKGKLVAVKGMDNIEDTSAEVLKALGVN